MSRARRDGLRWILAGGALMLAGWGALFLIVLGRLPTSLWLNFAAYGANLCGLFLALYGLAESARTGRT